MIDLAQQPFWLGVAVFLAATAVIGIAGVAMTAAADRLADAARLGEALMGALFVGATTSLSGTVTSIAAAAEAHADLAVSNAIGGIAVQTAFLGIADLTYRRVNLEHAAASVANLTQGTLLVSLLAIPLVTMSMPEVAVYGVHPVSILLLLAYAGGLRLISRAQAAPMWLPRRTAETREDVPAEPPAAGAALVRLWLRFAVLAGTVGIAGYAVAEAGVEIAARTGLTETVVGGLFTATSTSLPELVVVLAAVRRGALTLAVGDILGGNSFDVLILAFSDFAYRDGSIYHVLTGSHVFLISVPILMTGVLLLGMLRREKHGIANIGFESVLVLALYVGAFAVLFATG